MMEETKFVIENDKGEQIECEILFTFEHQVTGKNYIVYTDNSEDEDGNTMVYASIFDPTEASPILHPIETEEEWQMIDDILASIEEDEE